MDKLKNSIFYVTVISGCSLLMYWIIIQGRLLETDRNITVQISNKGQWGEFLASMQHNIGHPLAILLAQIITIVITARLFGWFANKIGQPSVIGEMIAGIFLGPSLVGMYFPEFSDLLFPAKSLGNLQFLSQIGLIFFMYIVGMELDLKVLKNKAHEAVVISHASIVFPFVLGVGFSYYIYRFFAPDNVQFLSFSLFIGIAMSITAFPVLARIVQERGIQKTRLGTIVITCAAADDITAWCLLAVVIAIVKAGSFVSALYVIALSVLYVLLMIRIVSPFLKRIAELHTSRESLGKPVVAIFFLVLIISSYLTEIIGIHALFGAFMAGAIMPDNMKFRNIFIEKVEDVALVLLLPLFFVFTGLRTEIGLLNDIRLWQITGLIIVVAVAGKFIGSALAAKFVGQGWKDSLTIGALMNTRGLMELVVLNIGYDLGVLSPQIFAMMVIMALSTTFMTGPALDLIDWLFKSSSEIPEELAQPSKFKILISFVNPKKGRKLLRLANGMVRKNGVNASITAMHIAPIEELHHYDTEEYEKEKFSMVVDEAKQLNQKITTYFKASGNIISDVIDVAETGDFDLVLSGVRKSIYEGSLLGKMLGFTTRIIDPERIVNQIMGKENWLEASPFDEQTVSLLTRSNVPVGILIDRDLKDFSKILIPMYSEKDAFLLKYARKFVRNTDAQITLFSTEEAVRDSLTIRELVRSVNQEFPNHIRTIYEGELTKPFLQSQGLLLISYESWKKLLDDKAPWLSDIPSSLVLNENR